jgi:D-3-phosphoglycerate dehydrogenase
MKALITDSIHPILMLDLEALGIACTYLPEISQSDVEALIGDFQILIINSKILVDAAFIDKASSLKIIGRLGSGLEIIDLKCAAEKGITVFNSPEGNRDAVGEHAIGMLLALFNQLNKAHQDVVACSWDREARRGEELKGKKVGLIGYGNTGKAMAQKLSGFEIDCFFYDKYLENETSPYAKQVTLEYLQEQAEVISIHLPYNTETHYFFNKDFFDKCKKPFYLINTSRGKILNTKDLLEELISERILGACLDVFENELPGSSTAEENLIFTNLANSDKVQLSPHIAGWTYQSKFKLAKTLSDKIASIL